MAADRFSDRPESTLSTDRRPVERHAPRPAPVEQEATLGISVVIPTYNESENVLQVVERCRRALVQWPSEVIVVDDDSPDGTGRLVRTTYDGDAVRLVRRTDERGLATAVLRGFQEATHELCAVIDADLQHPPERLPDLVAAFDDDTDLVIGSRHVDGGGIENWPVRRQLVSRGARLVAKRWLPQVRDIGDPLSGFFVVRRSVVEGVPLSPAGYKILLDILVRCEYDRVREVPYVFREREFGSSKLTGGEYLNFLRHLIELRLESRSPPDASPAGRVGSHE